MIRRYINKYFYLSRGEHTGTLVLLVLVFIIIGTTIILTILPTPKKKTDYSQYDKEITEWSSGLNITKPTNNYAEFSAGKIGNYTVYNKNKSFNDQARKRRDTTDLFKVKKTSEHKKSSYTPKIIDINTAADNDLQQIYGVGKVYSARIIKYRDILGGFSGTQQFQEIYGLPDSTRQELERRTSIDKEMIKKINLKDASYKELIRHPYLDDYQVKAILKYIEYKKDIQNSKELLENKILNEADFLKLEPYLGVE